MLVVCPNCDTTNRVPDQRVSDKPLCGRCAEALFDGYPLALTRVDVAFSVDAKTPAVECIATVETVGRTGVEMEALTAVSVGLLTIYDMCKAVDRGMRVEVVELLEKKGGKSGHWRAGARNRAD